MTVAITYTIPGARTLDQLTEPTLDGHPDENANENCVAASLAEGLHILDGGTFVGDELKDAVYGQGFVGVQSAHAYIGYCSERGVKLASVAGTQAALIATIHREVSAGHPVVVTMPSMWGTAPADPLHPAGYTHVGLAVGIGTDAIRVMNPWHGFMQDASDEWWAARLCYGQVWVMQKTAASTTGGATMTTGVPAGWRDDGKILTAPNGITVGTGMRAKVLAWPGGWPAWNVPLEEEHHMASLELLNPSLGAGTQQIFRATVLEWTPTHGVIMMAVGAELQATRAALAKTQGALDTADAQAAHDAAIIGQQQGQVAALTHERDGLKAQVDVADAQIATLTQQVAALQAQVDQAAAQTSAAQAESADELARGAAHAFVSSFASAFTSAFTQAVTAALAQSAAAPAAAPAAGS